MVTPSVAREAALPDWAGESFREVALVEIHPSHTNPRKTFDDLDELVESVSKHGVLQPILIRPLKTEFTYEIVAGERRWRAAKKAKLGKIPARIEAFTDAEAREVQIIENLQRQDLTVLEEATGFKALLDAGTYDARAIAEAVGKSVSFVWQRVKLLDAHPQILDALGNGALEAGHVVQLARLDHETQLLVLEEAGVHDMRFREKGFKQEYVSVRALARIVDELMKFKLAEAPFPLDEDLELHDETLGACTVCVRNSSVQGGLFPEIHEEGICSSPSCFAKKWASLVVRSANVCMGKKEEWAPIAVGSGHDHWAWTRSPVGRAVQLAMNRQVSVNFTAIPRNHDPVKGELVGIVCVSSKKTQPVGSTCRVTMEFGWSPKKPGQTSDKPELSPKEKEAKTKSLLTRKAQRIALTAVRERIRSNVPWPPPTEVTRRVLRGFMSRLWHEHFVLLARARGWVHEEIVTGKNGKERVKVTPWSPMDKCLEETLAAMDDQDLMSCALEATLIQQLEPDKKDSSYGPTKRTDLKELGKVLEYDYDAEMRKALAAVKPAPAKKKAAPKRKAPAAHGAKKRTRTRTRARKGK